MTTLKFSRPTEILSPHREHEWDEYELRCRQFKVDPKTLLSLPIPDGHVVLWKPIVSAMDVCNGLRFEKPERMTELLIDGFEFVAHDIYYKRDEAFLEENPHLCTLEEDDSTESTEEDSEEIFQMPDLSFSREDIALKLNEHYKYLDHAFALLGKDDTDPQGARSRFARFVTGDFKDEGKNYRAKSLHHETAGRCFYRFIKGTQWKTHLELARQIVLDNWTQLEGLLDAECYALPKMDDVWLDRAVITNMSAKAFEVEGWGWLPKSKVKFVKGKMVIPAWLVQSIADKEEA